MQSRLNFIRQQGFKDAAPVACDMMYPALMWQPRIVLVLVSLGVLFETGWYFIALSVILGWSALLPRLSPFDAIYNRIVAQRKRIPRLTPAPGPRRGAQGIAGLLSLAIGLAMLARRFELAWLLQLILLIAVAVLVFGKLCLGSFLFHTLTGQFAYARRTMPWSRGDQK